ncbi:Delta-like protein 4 [Globodera pallida]|nr:Delta-like protein 4 [Globodera pallida]
MTSAGAERRHFFSLLLRIWTLFLTFHRLSAAGHIDLTIEQLTLRRAPPGCCSQISPSSVPSYNDGLCALNFRLCVSAVDHLSFVGALSQRNCDVLSRNFTVVVRSARPVDAADRTFAVDAPSGSVHQRRFDFASPITPNVSVQLDILSDRHKLLLSSRFLSPLPTHDDGPIARVFRYVNYGNVFTYRLKALCSAGSVGPKCTETCEPPKAGDHYFCAVDGMRCVPGWGGTRCLQPQCPQKCANGGRCLRPGHCECLSGWTGDRCDQCVPKGGCRNGYCTNEQPGSCICLPNWTGANCDVLVNKCLQRPCKNGGRCSTDGANGDFFRCICPPGFTGRDCGIPFANCKNATCAGQNQQCVPLEHGYTCACVPGFDGPNCGQSHQQQQRRQQQQQIGHDGGTPTAPKNFNGLMTMNSDKRRQQLHVAEPAGGRGGELNSTYTFIFNGTCVVFFLLFGVCVAVRWLKFHWSDEEKKKPTVGRLVAAIAPGGFTSKAKAKDLTAEKVEENGRNTLLVFSEKQNSDNPNRSNDRRTGRSSML